jgi:putative oxidoreductase
MSSARNSTPANLGLLLMRVMLGAVFSFHGAQKLFGAFDGDGLKAFAASLESMQVPWPMESALAAALTEFVGGLALATGIGARVMAIPLVITMLVAIVKVHPNAFSARKNGMEYPLTLAVMTAGIGLLGPGSWTLLVPKRKKSRPAPSERKSPEN